MSGTQVHARRRGDIQGLRAVAILTVVVYHAFHASLPGGFVGVDVFFVISGFLIAGILIREHEARGRISLSRFWARRVRRLMPATIVVAAATLIISAFRLDPIALVRTFENAGWSLLSLANVHFANSPTGGYFANSVINPFLHFWSLSVEEQFYILLPLLLLLVGLIRRRWALPALIAAIFVGSLVASVLLSAENGPNAFYSLGTRAWELAIGVGLAYLTSVVRMNLPRVVRVIVFATGLLAIVVAATQFSSSMAWPGYAALLPTLGAALVIMAGTGGSAGSITRALDNPVARYIGDVSFSFYLWHWPVIVLAPFAFASDPLLQLLLVVLAFVLAVLTYHFVEQPFQRMRPAATPRRILAIGLPTAAAVALTSFIGAAIAMPNSGIRVEPLAAQYQNLTQGPGVVPPAVPTNVRPSLLDVGWDLQAVYKDCYGPGVPECWSGDPEGQETILVVGDSYAGMFWPSIEQAAKDNGWRSAIVSRAGCALLEPTPVGPESTQDWRNCVEWQGRALDRIEEIEPDLIIYINSMTSVGSAGSEDWISAAKEAVRRMERVAPVVMLGPTPIFVSTSESCLAANFLNPQSCSRSLSEAVPVETRDAAIDVIEVGGAELLDLNGILCDAEGSCPMIVGDTIMYRDAGHISNAYSTHFATVFGNVIRPYLDWTTPASP